MESDCGVTLFYLCVCVCVCVWGYFRLWHLSWEPNDEEFTCQELEHGAASLKAGMRLWLGMFKYRRTASLAGVQYVR